MHALGLVFHVLHMAPAATLGFCLLMVRQGTAETPVPLGFGLLMAPAATPRRATQFSGDFSARGAGLRDSVLAPATQFSATKFFLRRAASAAAGRR